MKFVRFTFFLFLGLLTGYSSQAQERYLKEIFTGFTVTKSVTYGNNLSILTQAPVATDLKMDVYAPAGDTLKNRAAILVFHTGSFLPPLYNGGITGDRNDSTTVEICRRLARMGYVVFNATYRLGWNPAATGADGQNIRTSTLLQAAYRGIQDGRSLARFLRKSVAENSNPYGIDPSRIAAWGQGTGGYISMGMAFLDRFQQEVVLEKFIDTKTLQPYIDTTLFGNLYGTTTTTLCLANHPGYSSDIKAAINMGGAIGDITWLEGKPGEPVIVGFHVVSDPFAPFADGPVIVPTTGDFVVNVSGTYSVVKKANDLGTNAPIADANSDLTNPINAVNKVLSQVPIDYRGQAIKLSTDNMFPFVLPGFQSGPWEWWDKPTLNGVVAFYNTNLGTNFNADTLHRNGLLTNPDMSKAKGMAYIDTIMGISLPRLYLALNLATSTKQVLKAEDVELKIAPNPVSDIAYFRSSPNHTMRDIAIYSMDGRLMTGAINLNTNYYELYRGKLPPGIYVAQVRFDHGIVASKIVVQ